MEFKEVLNKYIKIVGCTSKELSIRSRISESVISRYRSGERTPKENSEQIRIISSVLQQMVKEKDIKKYLSISIYDELLMAVKEKDSFDYESFSYNFNLLINTLKLNINEMSKYIVFDPSHISRIRHCKTRPSDPITFCKKTASFIISKNNNYQYKSSLYTLLKININENISDNDLFICILNFLTNNTKKKNPNNIEKFLNNLDEFDLNDYIKAISFDKLKIPSLPFYKMKSKNYYGLEEMKSGELDFFKATILSKNSKDIFMCSDMPMEDMAKDVEFGKKWMFAIAMCLKKGLRLNIVHNLDRPFNEMMLGLESWIPIYMTGQISPFYLKEVKNNIYQHLNYVSDDYVLEGQCIKGYHGKGKYCLMTSKKDIMFYKEKSLQILKKASPLMDIYNKENMQLYDIFLKKDFENKCDRKRILNTLPLFTMSDDLLDKILKRNRINKNDMKIIKDYKNKEKDKFDKKIEYVKIIDIIYEYKSLDDFKKYDVSISLENIFYDRKINYTYEEYKEHLRETINYKKKNYSIIFNDFKTFNNILIDIVKDNYVIISKNKNPNIHFVIKHPKLLAAIDNFNPLVREK